MLDLKGLENKIINADCMDILKQLPDKCIDLVLTDPPYGINVAKNGKVGGGQVLQSYRLWCKRMGFRNSTQRNI